MFWRMPSQFLAIFDKLHPWSECKISLNEAAKEKSAPCLPKLNCGSHLGWEIFYCVAVSGIKHCGALRSNVKLMELKVQRGGDARCKFGRMFPSVRTLFRSLQLLRDLAVSRLSTSAMGIKNKWLNMCTNKKKCALKKKKKRGWWEEPAQGNAVRLYKK